MDQDPRIRELYSRNMQQVNSILSKSAISLIILCPVLLLVNFAGITHYTSTEVIQICIVIAVLSLAPFLVNSRIYNENINRVIVLICMEAGRRTCSLSCHIL